MNDRARETRADQIVFHQCRRPARSENAGDRPRARAARPAHHLHLSRLLSAGSASANSPGTRSASRTAIRCSRMDIGADGMKTGFTNEAGYNLVGSAVQNGLRLIVVVTGLKNAKGPRRRGAGSCWNGASRISTPGCCSPKARPWPRPRSMAARRAASPVVAKGPIKLMVPRGVSDRITAKMVYTGPVRAPVREGQPIGTAAGLARRRQGAGSAAAGGRKRRRGLDLAARLRCRRGTCDQPVPLRRQTAISRGVASARRARSGRRREQRRRCADASSHSRAARAPASRPMRRCWRRG